MSADILASYGMICIGTVQIIEDRFVITIPADSVANMDHCIYAFLIGGEILRIGKSKDPLRARLRSWEHDVSDALANIAFRTPAAEAAVWKAMLAKHGVGHIFARKGSLVTTPVGELNAYLSEEETLIDRHRPRLCRR